MLYIYQYYLESVVTGWRFTAKSPVGAKQINPSCSTSCLKADEKWLWASLIPPGSPRLSELEISGTEEHLDLGSAPCNRGGSKSGREQSSSPVCCGCWSSHLL